MRRWAIAAGGAALAVCAPLWSQAVAPANAAGGGQPAEHRAAVLVDTGTEVKSVCVRFREESITGIEALQRAAVDPVLQAFSGKGAAVCSLCGVGCPAGESCLTCNAEGRFWSYSRAAAGTTTLRTSGAGASSTTVRDGDVEGWRWGLGGAPPFVTVQQVCGEVAPITTTSTGAVTTLPSSTTSTVPAPSTPSTRATVPRTGPLLGAATTAPATVTISPQVPSSSTVPTVATEPNATSRSTLGAAAPASSERESGGGSGWTGLALLAIALGGLLMWSARLRRSRRAAGST